MVVYSPRNKPVNKPVNKEDFEAATKVARDLIYGFQSGRKSPVMTIPPIGGMDGLDAALALLQAVHEFIHWNVGEEAEDDIRIQLCGFLLTGIDNPDKFANFLKRLARDCAVTAVDSPKGYTMEFAPSPAAHREEYDQAETAIQHEIFRAFHLTIEE